MNDKMTTNTDTSRKTAINTALTKLLEEGDSASAFYVADCRQILNDLYNAALSVQGDEPPLDRKLLASEALEYLARFNEYNAREVEHVADDMAGFVIHLNKITQRQWYQKGYGDALATYNTTAKPQADVCECGHHRYSHLFDKDSAQFMQCSSGHDGNTYSAEEPYHKIDPCPCKQFKPAPKADTIDREAAITIDKCKHESFNSGYQRRCESGCGHTADYILGWTVRGDWEAVQPAKHDEVVKEPGDLERVLMFEAGQLDERERANELFVGIKDIPADNFRRDDVLLKIEQYIAKQLGGKDE